jgi:hypothetical protein
MKAACTGCRTSSRAKPSIVSTSALSLLTASARQELTRRPSSKTVHAPWQSRCAAPSRARARGDRKLNSFNPLRAGGQQISCFRWQKQGRNGNFRQQNALSELTADAQVVDI